MYQEGNYTYHTFPFKKCTATEVELLMAFRILQEARLKCLSQGMLHSSTPLYTPCFMQESKFNLLCSYPSLHIPISEPRYTHHMIKDMFITF